MTLTQYRVTLRPGDHDHCYVVASDTTDQALKWPLEQYGKLRDRFRDMWKRGELKDVTQVDWLPHELVRLWQINRPHEKTQKEEQQEMDEIKQRIGEPVWNKLRPFQQKGIAYIIRRTRGRGLLADDQGLGKSLQALLLSRYYSQNPQKQVLIICPSSVRYTWQEQIRLWTSSDTAQIKVIHDSKCMEEKGEEEAKPKYVVVSYNLLLMKPVRDWLQSTECDFEFLILDESHYIKSATAKRTQLSWPFAHNCPYVVALSGTPIPNSTQDLFGQLHALQPEVFSEFFYANEKEYKKAMRLPTFERPFMFAERYCDGKFELKRLFGGRLKVVPVTKGRTRSEELHTILETCLMIRRLKTQVVTELEAKIRSKIVFPVPPHQSQVEELRRCHKMSLQKGSEARAMSNFMKLYSELCVIKIPFVLQFLKERLETWKEKVLIFAYHLAMSNAIEEMLKEECGAQSYVRIDGTNSNSEKRIADVNRFKTDGDCRFAILGITSASTGLNLQEGTVVVFAELYWSPDTLFQGEDRAHRMGQQKIVNIYYPFIQDTVDDCLYRLIDRKARGSSLILDGEQKPFLLSVLQETEE